MESPQYIETVQPEICDVELNLVGGVESSDSIKRAWDLMDDQDSRSLPVLSDGMLENIVSRKKQFFPRFVELLGEYPKE